MLFSDLHYLEKLGNQDSFIHRCDARAKLLVCIVFIVTVVTYGKYDVIALLPFLIFPVLLISLADLPLMYFIKRLLIVSVFALFVGVWNPILDRTVFTTIGGWEITGGWLSFSSIMMKFVLCASAALILIATSGVYEICLALDQFKVPTVFVNQLLFLYRYIFVIQDEAFRMIRAAKSRSSGHGQVTIKTYTQIIGHLLLRSIDRAEAIYRSMKSRGFNGHICLMKQLHWRPSDTAFVVFCCAIFTVCRWINVPVFVGQMLSKGGV